MTKDGRLSVVKTVKTLGEAAKQSIQQTRKLTNNRLKTYSGAKGVSKDEVFKLDKEVRSTDLQPATAAALAASAQNCHTCCCLCA